jgi:hypothetical protein
VGFQVEGQNKKVGLKNNVKFYAFKKIGSLSDLPNLLDVRWNNTSDVMTHVVLPCGGTCGCGCEGMEIKKAGFSNDLAF